MERKRVLIMGAAGRDFHNYNVYFRDNEQYEVVAFTATQIPDIEGRVYPAELAGELYPEGIPIYAEEDLVDLIKQHSVDEVVFAYSDVSHEYVMHKASIVLAAGADYRLMGLDNTQIASTKPVVSVCAVRTGSGKSQTTRRVSDILRDLGYTVAAIRHPMPYGDLVKQAVQRFADYADLDKHDVTIEEREEYEPHIDRGVIVYAGVDYEAILRQAEQEADIILWDGGNNDLPFYKADLNIVVADPHRPGHELTYHPGEANLRMADVVVINKVDTADPDSVTAVRDSIRMVAPDALVLEGASPILVDDPDAIRGKRVLVVEDGPTLTHGEMAYGAGVVAARRFGAAEIIDPRPYAVGSIADTFAKYPTTGALLPAMGYGAQQAA
jgi:predicted GTPase